MDKEQRIKLIESVGKAALALSFVGLAAAWSWWAVFVWAMCMVAGLCLAATVDP